MICNTLKILLRILMAACLTLGVAVDLSVFIQRQAFQDVIATPVLMGVTAVCGIVLFFLSLFCLKRFRRLAIYGVIISIFSLLTLLLPTV